MSWTTMADMSGKGRKTHKGSHEKLEANKRLQLSYADASVEDGSDSITYSTCLPKDNNVTQWLLLALLQKPLSQTSGHRDADGKKRLLLDP